MIIGTERSPSWRRQKLTFRPKLPTKPPKQPILSLLPFPPVFRAVARVIGAYARLLGAVARVAGADARSFGGTARGIRVTARVTGAVAPFIGGKPLAPIHLPLIFDDYSKLSGCAAHDSDQDDHGF